MSVLKEQRDEDSSRTQGELHRARDEVRSLQQALEAAAAERDHEVATVQSSLATVTKDLDKWRQTASKYEREIDNLQGDLRQQSMQWQKTAEIQGNAILTSIVLWSSITITIINVYKLFSYSKC